MKLRCPACGAEATLEALAQAADLKALDAAASAFGLDWFLVSEYLECFKARQGGGMTVKKTLRLTREVWTMWESGKFCVGGVWHRIGREEFKAALQEVCNRNLAALTNHNYLKKVLQAGAEKYSKRLEKEQREREEQLKAGVREEGPDSRLADPEWRGEFLRRKRRAYAKGLSPEAQAQAMKDLKEFCGK